MKKKKVGLKQLMKDFPEYFPKLTKKQEKKLFKKETEVRSRKDV